MEKVLGCWEHLSMVWSVLKEARSKKSSAASIWLDIANTYGSIAHKLIFFGLWRYGIPNKWIQIVESYFAEIFIKSFSGSAASSWHRHQRGIIASCTISINLFYAGMNVALEYSLHTNVPKFVINNNPQTLKWVSLHFWADRSRSIVIIKGRSMNTIPFSLAEPKDFSSYIASIHSRPI